MILKNKIEFFYVYNIMTNVAESIILIKEQEKVFEKQLEDIQKNIDGDNLRHDWIEIEKINNIISEIKAKLTSLRYNRTILESRIYESSSK